MACEICGASLTNQSLSTRQRHYEQHFETDQYREYSYILLCQGLSRLFPGSQAGPSEIIDLSTSLDTIHVGKQSAIDKAKQPEDKEKPVSLPPVDKRNIFWFQSTATQPPPNFTPGVICDEIGYLVLAN